MNESDRSQRQKCACDKQPKRKQKMCERLFTPILLNHKRHSNLYSFRWKTKNATHLVRGKNGITLEMLENVGEQLWITNILQL